LLFKEIIGVYSEDQTISTNTPCEKNAEVLNIRADVITSMVKGVKTRGNNGEPTARL
jgi:hypothetical protein